MGMLNLMCSPCVGGHQVSEGLKLGKTYWIVWPKAASTKPKVATFRDWLLAKAADDAGRLRKVFAG
jgi:DNA-binding transcriptional LysR family regulator